MAWFKLNAPTTWRCVIPVANLPGSVAQLNPIHTLTERTAKSGCLLLILLVCETNFRTICCAQKPDARSSTGEILHMSIVNVTSTHRNRTEGRCRSFFFVQCTNTRCLPRKDPRTPWLQITRRLTPLKGCPGRRYTQNRGKRYVFAHGWYDRVAEKAIGSRFEHLSFSPGLLWMPCRDEKYIRWWREAQVTSLAQGDGVGFSRNPRSLRYLALLVAVD
jgi:hypothetical protein